MEAPHHNTSSENSKQEHANETAPHTRDEKYLGDMVYGANDGIITTFVVASGAIGASLPAEVIVILGITNLIADGYSMGVSSYLSTISNRRLLEKQKREKERLIEQDPSLCQKEVREVFQKFGIPDEEAVRLAHHVSQDKKICLTFLLQQKSGEAVESDRAIHHGAATFGAFILAGAIPLFPFIFGLTETISPFIFSIISTGIALSIVGIIRTVVTRTGWITNITEMLLIGGTAAAIAYSAGYILATVFGIVI